MSIVVWGWVCSQVLTVSEAVLERDILSIGWALPACQVIGTRVQDIHTRLLWHGGWSADRQRGRERGVRHTPTT